MSFNRVSVCTLAAALVAGFAIVANTVPSQAGGAEPAEHSPPLRLAQKDDSKAPAAKKDAAPAATPNQPAPNQPAPWAVTCSDRAGGKLICEMTQNVIEDKTRRQLLLLSIRNASDDASPVLVIRAFHGLYLPAGLNLGIDQGKPTPVPFQKSDQAGIYAALPLSEALVGELKKGKELRVAMQLQKDQPLEIKVPLTGFPAAFDKVRSVK
jgi:invasion protein IalB